MAIPTFQAAGSTVSGTGAITVPWPAHVTDDVALLFVESANQAVTLSSPNGFVAVTNSPQGTGTAGAAASTRLTVFWARATSSSMADPVVADSGTRQIAFIITYRGCIATGNPWDVTAGSVQATSSTAVSIPGATTTVADCLVVAAVTNGIAVNAPMVRGVANASLASLTKRKSTQPDGVGGGVNANALRVGLLSGVTEVGKGPGGDTGSPLWGALNINTTPSAIDGLIDTADAADQLLILNAAGSRPGWNDANGNFSFALYEAKVRRYENNPKLADAIARRRVILWAVDEPNISDFNGKFTATVVNNACGLHKSIWPGSIVLVRTAPGTLRDGWGDELPPPGTKFGPSKYTHLDYAWTQYGGQHHRSGLTPLQLLTQQQSLAALLDVGLGCSLNWINGGIKTDMDGIAACWDYLNNGSSSGYVVGSPAKGGRSSGDQVACGQGLDPAQNVMAGPLWIRRWIDTIFNDPTLPFAMLWNYPSTSTGSGWGLNYVNRADFVSAFDYAVSTAAARSNWVGWRTPKS